MIILHLKFWTENARELFIHRRKSKTIKFVFIVYEECFGLHFSWMDEVLPFLKIKIKKPKKTKIKFRLPKIFIKFKMFNGSLFFALRDHIIKVTTVEKNQDLLIVGFIFMWVLVGVFDVAEGSFVRCYFYMFIK